MNYIPSLVQVAIGCLTVVVAFLASATIEWYLHCKVLHGNPASGHEEHHEQHAKLLYKHAHKDASYGVDLPMVRLIVLLLGLISLLIGYLISHTVLIGTVTVITTAAYFWFFELIHRRVHQPKENGWLEGTWVYKYLDVAHRVHHARDNRNFCIVVPLIDWLFGTLHRPSASAPTES